MIYFIQKRNLISFIISAVSIRWFIFEIKFIVIFLRHLTVILKVEQGVYFKDISVYTPRKE